MTIRSIKDLDSPEGYVKLVAASGLYFASRAWEGFIYKGRGALVVRMSEIIELRNDPNQFKFSAEYAPVGADILASLGPWPDGAIEQVLGEYDPEKEVILIFVGFNGAPNCFAWRAPESVAPPTAYIKWRAKHPIGIRIDPDTPMTEFLRLAIEREEKNRCIWEAEREQILSDPVRQAGFMRSLMKRQEILQAELEAGGVGIKQHGGAYQLGEMSSPPNNSFERFSFLGTVLEYLAVTTAVNQMVISCEKIRMFNKNWLPEVARVGIEAYDDKLMVAMAQCISSDMVDETDFGEDAEEIRKIFLVLTAARLRVRMKKYPRLWAALKAEAKVEGKTEEEVLLSKLLTGMMMAWSEFETLSHNPFTNDSKELLNKLAICLTTEEPLDAKHERLRRERDRKQEKKGEPITSNAYSIEDHFSIEDMMNQLSMSVFKVLEQQQEARAELAEATRKAGLSDFELKASLLQQDGYTAKEIASQLNKDENRVKQALWRARNKFKKLRPMDDK